MPQQRLDNIINGIRGHFENEVAQSMIACLNAVHAATPRDTSLAANSWQITVGPPSSPSMNPSVTERGARFSGSSGIAASWTMNNQELVLSNDVPYIVILNERYGDFAGTAVSSALLGRQR